jgi:hypothetical protein
VSVDKPIPWEVWDECIKKWRGILAWAESDEVKRSSWNRLKAEFSTVYWDLCAMCYWCKVETSGGDKCRVCPLHSKWCTGFSATSVIAPLRYSNRRWWLRNVRSFLDYMIEERRKTRG